jgi:G3E family GTPase
MTTATIGPDPRIPVTLVTGLLGSGKTTLLSRVLRQPALGRSAVIINEFGEVPLDQALIERTDGPVVVLAGGCLCCAMTGDVVSTLLDLHQRRDALPFVRVIIETSGLADPGPILAPLIQAPELTARFRVDGVVALVDALQGLRELERQRIAVKQIALADRIILTKSDLAASRAVTALRERLASLNPWAPLLVANHGEVDVDWLLDPAPRGARATATGDQAVSDPEHHHHDHDHHLGIRSFSLWFDRPLDWDRFAAAVNALTEAHGEKVLRLKGLLNLVGRPTPTAVHGVQHFLHPALPLAAWPDSDRRSRVVVITDGLDPAAVRPFFSALTAGPGELAASAQDPPQA